MNIGLSQRILHYNKIAYDCLEHGWYNLLSGHTLSCIPNNPDQDFAAMVAALDLVIFTGGDAHPQRLIVETRLLTQCYATNTPVLGVCHGAFVINHLEGGVNTAISGHRNTEHTVVLDNKRCLVNSFHSNQIAELAPDLVELARSDDDCIEAFKHHSQQIWGLVWHPERMEKPILPEDLRRFLYDRND